MFDSTFDKSTRKSHGIHYTPDELVDSILAKPFSELRSSIDKASTLSEIQSAYNEFQQVKLFDPACGSGNFLVRGYLYLVKLERHIWKRITELGGTPPSTLSFNPSHLYGIDIEQSAIDECARRVQELYDKLKARGLYN